MESEFLKDLNEDMKDPEFRREYMKASQHIEEWAKKQLENLAEQSHKSFDDVRKRRCVKCNTQVHPEDIVWCFDSSHPNAPCALPCPLCENVCKAVFTARCRKCEDYLLHE